MDKGRDEIREGFMNIGIYFNTKSTKAAVLIDGSDVEACKIFETKNVLAFINGDVFVGDDGFNKFLIEKNGAIYSLDQIIEWNGIIVNKKQISVEKCLSILFSYLLNKIKLHAQTEKIDIVCISIPYDKFYYWHDLIPKSFSLIALQKVRIISQPAAFFAQPSSSYLHGRMIQEREHFYNQAIKDYEGKPLYKKLFLKKPVKPVYQKVNGVPTVYLFISVSQDNSNVSLVDYGQGVLEIISTQYTNTFSERQIKNLVFDYFLAEIRKDKQGFSLGDRKTILRIQEIVNDFLKTQRNENFYEINIPYVLCNDGQYRTININIDLDRLNDSLNPTFDTFIGFVKKVAKQSQDIRGEIGAIIFIGEYLDYSYIHKIIENGLSKIPDRPKICFENIKSLAIGTLNCLRALSGERHDFVALEVIPFSILIRLRGGDFIELIKKDTTIPTRSKEQIFEIRNKNKSKYIEIHLTTKEGEHFQSLNVWKIEVGNSRVFKVQVDICPNYEIKLRAFSQDGNNLSVQRGSTFSFNGDGFEIGIKGKDIRQYILNQFNYLSATLKSDELTIFEPDSTFYSMLKQGDPFKALRYLGYFLKLKSLPDVELTDSNVFEELGVGGFISGKKISIPEYFKEDPYGFGYVLAHELSHYILIHEEGVILDDEQENEILTEIFIIYKGMGKLFLNGFNTKDVKDFTHRSRGYLDEEIIKYIHQVYFDKFNISISEYKENLTRDGRKILGEFI